MVFKLYTSPGNVEIEDNIIRVNKYLPQPTPLVINGGLEVYRGGTAPNAQIIWDEATGRWKAGLTGSLLDIAYSTSDIRLKKDIQELGRGLSFITKLRPVQYRLKEGNNRIDFGFIAQDIEALLGSGYNVLGIGDDEERMLSLRYTDFIAPMVKAIQEQQAQIDEQKAMIEELRAELAAIKQRIFW